MMKRLLGAAAIGSLILSGPALAAPPTTELTDTQNGIGTIANSMSSTFNFLSFQGDPSYLASSLPDAVKCPPAARCFLPSSVMENASPVSFSDVKDRLKSGDRIDYALIDGRGETMKRVYLDVRKKDSATSDVIYLRPGDFPAGDVMAFLNKNAIPNKATKQFHTPTAAESVGYGLVKMVIYTIL